MRVVFVLRSAEALPVFLRFVLAFCACRVSQCRRGVWLYSLWAPSRSPHGVFRFRPLGFRRVGFRRVGFRPLGFRRVGFRPLGVFGFWRALRVPACQLL